ncbi:hypothetical protein ACLB2K_046952 [Fragaria x ananassa]
MEFGGFAGDGKRSGKRWSPLGWRRALAGAVRWRTEENPHRKAVRTSAPENPYLVEKSSIFPFLIDPNTGISMYESGEIVRYLFQQYGKGRKPSPGLLERY